MFCLLHNLYIYIWGLDGLYVFHPYFNIGIFYVLISDRHKYGNWICFAFQGDIVFEYILDLIDIPIVYYLVAVIIGVMVWTCTKKVSLSLCWSYIFIAVIIMVLGRGSYDGNHFQPHLFWSWGVPSVRNQLVMNIVGFIPLGILLAPSFGWKSVPVVTVFSFVIEIMQLLLQCGLFEFDDVLHNTIGALIGVCLFQIFVWIRMNS